MKKTVFCLSLILLCLFSLGACSSLSDLEAYRALQEELHSLTEYRIEGEVHIERIDLARPVIHRFQSGYISVEQEAAQLLYASSRAEDVAPFFDIEVTIYDAHIYADLTEQTQWRLSTFTGEDSIPAEVSALVEDYLFVQMPLAHELSPEALFGAYAELFSEDVLEAHLSRDGDSFTLKIEGETVEQYAYDMLYAILFQNGAEFVNEFVGADAEGREGTVAFLTEPMDTPDWSGAHLIVRYTKIDRTISVFAELYVPDWLLATSDTTITPQEVTIGIPENLQAAPLETHLERLDDAIFAVFMAASSFEPAMFTPADFDFSLPDGITLEHFFHAPETFMWVRVQGMLSEFHSLYEADAMLEEALSHDILGVVFNASETQLEPASLVEAMFGQLDDHYYILNSIGATVDVSPSGRSAVLDLSVWIEGSDFLYSIVYLAHEEANGEVYAMMLFFSLNLLDEDGIAFFRELSSAVGFDFLSAASQSMERALDSVSMLYRNILPTTR